MSPQPPDPGQPSCNENKPSAPKEWLSFWAGIALKNPLGCVSFGDGVPPPGSFLKVTPPTGEGMFPMWCYRNWDVSQE